MSNYDKDRDCSILEGDSLYKTHNVKSVASRIMIVSLGGWILGVQLRLYRLPIAVAVGSSQAQGIDESESTLQRNTGSARAVGVMRTSSAQCARQGALAETMRLAEVEYSTYTSHMQQVHQR